RRVARAWHSANFYAADKIVGPRRPDTPWTARRRRLRPLSEWTTAACCTSAPRYQEHLKQCADGPAFESELAGAGRIKELEARERHKKFQRLAEQIHKVTELRSMLTRMRSHAKHLGALMEELNSALPARLPAGGRFPAVHPAAAAAV
uniref:BLOC-1-related complex subunit 5 n=1 Tax=Macrostomum lignano TaxID=282301 RepID=A0A1I8FJC2_9PLAT